MSRYLLNAVVSRSSAQLHNQTSKHLTSLNTLRLSTTFRSTLPKRGMEEPKLTPFRNIDYAAAAKNKTPVPIDARAADWSVGGGSNSFEWFSRIGVKVVSLIVATAVGIAFMNQPVRQHQTFLVDTKDNLPTTLANPTFTLQPKSALHNQQQQQNNAV